MKKIAEKVSEIRLMKETTAISIIEIWDIDCHALALFLFSIIEINKNDFVSIKNNWIDSRK
jgi:hypothetical protein